MLTLLAQLRLSALPEKFGFAQTGLAGVATDRALKTGIAGVARDSWRQSRSPLAQAATQCYAAVWAVVLLVTHLKKTAPFEARLSCSPEQGDTLKLTLSFVSLRVKDKPCFKKGSAVFSA